MADTATAKVLKEAGTETPERELTAPKTAEAARELPPAQEIKEVADQTGKRALNVIKGGKNAVPASAEKPEISAETAQKVADIQTATQVAAAQAGGLEPPPLPPPLEPPQISVEAPKTGFFSRVFSKVGGWFKKVFGGLFTASKRTITGPKID